LDYFRRNGIVLQAFAALGHSSEPRLLDDPVITGIAKRVDRTPAQVLLTWAIQRGTALPTTSKTPSRIKENFEVAKLPEDAMREISEGIKTRVRFNAVADKTIFVARSGRTHRGKFVLWCKALRSHRPAHSTVLGRARTKSATSSVNSPAQPAQLGDTSRDRTLTIYRRPNTRRPPPVNRSAGWTVKVHPIGCLDAEKLRYRHL
jgi:hypothetical protein